MNFNCCSENFTSLPFYLKHLKSHEDNVRIYVRCTICNQTCESWDAFRKHNLRDHNDNNPIELYNIYKNACQNLISNRNDSNIDVTMENTSHDASDLEKMKLTYGQFLLDMTYQNKLKANTVDSLNKNTKELVISFLNNLKVYK